MSDFTRDQLIEFLKENVPMFSFTGEIDRLKGGNINVVWRAKGETKNVIIKHAPPHIAVNPDVPLSNSRIDFEARALKALNKGGRLYEITREEIRPPELVAYNKENSLIIMEDVGDFRQLNQVDIVNHSPEQIGKRLGRFIGNLHRTTLHDEKIGSDFQNIGIQKVRNQLQYQPAHEYADVPDAIEERIQKKSSNLGHRLLKPGKCLIMGDLWPPSVLVNMSNDIRLLDWEFAHFGRPLQDIGHFAAHCRMQHHIAKSEAVYDFWTETWGEFWSAYKETTGSFYDDLFDSEELTDIGVHIGTEILMRSSGPFKDGYVYESFDKTHPVLDEAKEMAIGFILNPEPVRFGLQ